jgi:hypothetical protein
MIIKVPGPAKHSGAEDFVALIAELEKNLPE